VAITAYNGPPGSGKSHALVKDVIVPAVLAGRRVVSNVDGLNANAIRAYCLEREKAWGVDHADKLGEVVLFHGEDSKQPFFWPTEATEKAGLKTFIQPGDLVVFDEWAMFYTTGDKDDATAQVEQFMRWHRHLTHPTFGYATDLCIATQAISDFSRRHRPLLSKSFLFKKLDAVGAAGSYTWHAFDGKRQQHSYQTGHGKYDKAIFPLYASSSAATSGNHGELKTNKKLSIWGGWKAYAAVLVPLALFGGGGVGLWSVWSDQPGNKAVMVAEATANGPSATATASGAAVAPVAPPNSPWRIVGQIDGDEGVRVIVTDEKGGVRMLKPDQFQFDHGRPVSGFVDGQRTVSEDRPLINGGNQGPSPYGGILQ
jgi:zona occludens toxin